MLALGLLPRAEAQRPPDIVPQTFAPRYIVSFLPGTTPAGRAEAASLAGATPLVDLGLIHAVAVEIPHGDVLALLQTSPIVEKVVPDHRIFALQSPVAASHGWNLATSAETIPAGVRRVGEPRTGAEGSGVGVMIGDTGVDWKHPDLNVAVDKFDAFGGDCMDRNGHGTHVAGTAAASMNGVGVVGVAPGATVYCGKVLSDNGAGSDSNIIALFEWVIARNAAGANPPILVLNLSLGRGREQEDFDGPLHRAIQAAREAGVTIVAAAGNDPSTEVKDQVPAGFPEVIAVASTTAEDGQASRCPFFEGSILADTASYFTTDGRFDAASGVGVTISAPGGTRENISPLCRITCEGILSTAIGGGTTDTLEGSPACGTSMAAPHISGLAARLIESGSLGPENVRARLSRDADRRGTGPLDSRGAIYTYDGDREGVGVWRP